MLLSDESQQMVPITYVLTGYLCKLNEDRSLSDILGYKPSLSEHVLHEEGHIHHRISHGT